MEISRKEKFGTKKKATKKWLKVVLAATFAMSVGTTSVFAAKPELADALYAKILEYTFKTEIDSELNEEKESLLKNLSTTVNGIINSTKQELDDKKDRIVADKKAELQKHYNDEIAEITKRKEEAVEKRQLKWNKKQQKQRVQSRRISQKKLNKKSKKPILIKSSLKSGISKPPLFFFFRYTRN
jgi:Skp family chaperone for outer membrane proteins